MHLRFRSLRSSSSGNCLMLWTERTAILIDCGISTQCACRELLATHMGALTPFDGVVVSHAHGDHISYPSLRVLRRRDITVHCHQAIVRQIHQKHIGDWASPPAFRPFSHEAFQIGDFDIQPIELPHDPDFPTFGFVIRAGGCKLLVATDFHDGQAVAGHLADADFIFIEANHDPELLRKYWNPSSLFHLSNPATARLLCEARRARTTPPRMVMLGHLSSRRNTESLALAAVQERFRLEGVELDFQLRTAPRHQPSEIITIQPRSTS